MPVRPTSVSTARLAIDFGLMTPAGRVIDELLALEAGERFLIAHDLANGDIARAFEHAATERRAEVRRIDLEALAPRPWSACPKEGLAAVAGMAATVFVVSNEDGEYNTRHAFVMAAAAAKTRHVHMLGVSRRAFVGSMMAPTARIFDLLHQLRGIMRPTSKIGVRSAAGTNVEIEMAPHLRWFANGTAVRAGQWINVPFGALVSSPGSVSGTYVVDAAVGGGFGARMGTLAGRSLKLGIEAGHVKAVECRDSAIKRYVEAFLAEAQGHDRIGLLSVGANLGILTALGEIIHDENMPGVHLALGETFQARTGATWTSHGQLAFAMADADVDVDGQPLIRRGRYVRFV